MTPSLITLCNEIQAVDSLSNWEALRTRLLGKKGLLSEQMRTLGKLDPEERKRRGEELNRLKETLSEALAAKKKELHTRALEDRLTQEGVDVTLPTPSLTLGRIHPLSHLTMELIHIFEKMGFHLCEGPDIEDDFHNFTALNIPPLHPARADQDTFYLPPGPNGDILLLRTQTSPVQIRTLLTDPPPLRIIVPGRVFRSDYDQTHTPMFHQLEGLVIDQKIHMGHLKGCLEEFFSLLFDAPVPLRLRPSFFPFTEPSAEVDILCDRQGNQLQIGVGREWLEVLGCGMVHPQVLRNCGLDPEVYQGFAFGVGVERLAMLKYGITDLRQFFENDIRWLSHYGFGLAS